LPEASDLSPKLLDNGEANAIIKAFSAMPRLFEILDIKKQDYAVDISSGAGFFASLMRDIGYNFHFYDDLDAARAGFVSGTDECRLLTLFRTIDHFADPRQDWEMVFSLKAEIIIGSASLFQEPGVTWDNLAPESGLRRFFHSPDTLSYLAAKYGRMIYRAGSYFIFVRQPLAAVVLEDLNHWE
jgi:hypothetical protein